MQRFLGALIAFILMVCASKTLRAEVFVPLKPKDLDKVEFYLLTIGRGEAAYTRFGHTILRMVDRENNHDYAFNWGIFNFEDPAFLYKFYIGDLKYMMGIAEFSSVIELYAKIERRMVLQEKLNLTRQQKSVLLDRLIWNAQPQNLHYQYNQFYDNCSTKPRDYLDEALGGRLAERYKHRASNVTYRDLIRGSSDGLWWVYTGLDVITNSLLDASISAWQEMFLPEKLRDQLLLMQAVGDDGKELAETPLLSHTKVLVDRPQPSPGMNPYFLTLLLIGLPLGVGGMLIQGTCSWQSQHFSFWRRCTYRLFGLGVLLYGAWSGLWGLLMTLNWLLSLYKEVMHNVNLILFWPVDWLFVVIGISLLKRGCPVRPHKWTSRCMVWLAKAHLIALAVLAVLWASGFLLQDVLPTLAVSGILAILCYWTLLTSGVQKE